MKRSAAEFAARLWDDPGPGWRVLRACLTPAAAIYGAAVMARNAAYGAGLLGARVVPARTVSIGNVRVGGTGKTPLTRWLAMETRRRGARVVIVSRGYGGSERRAHVVGDGVRVCSDVAASGDEAVMLARTSGVPVVAGRDRVAAARLAVDTFEAQLLLCDDAFQHRRLERDLDVVLVDAEERGGLGRVLPAGPLREPLVGVRRADVVLRRESNADALANDAIGDVRRIGFAPVSLVAPGPAGWQERPMGLLAEKQVLAVTGVARPGPVYETLSRWNASLADVLEYPDHHVYEARDWKEISHRARDLDLVVTTEKDLVKLEEFPFARDALVAIRLGVVVDNADELIDHVLGVRT